MRRGTDVVVRYLTVGEAAARALLHSFVAERVEVYDIDRDRPGIDGTFALSEHLTHGEISMQSCYRAALAAREAGRAEPKPFTRSCSGAGLPVTCCITRPGQFLATCAPNGTGFLGPRMATARRSRHGKSARRA